MGQISDYIGKMQQLHAKQYRPERIILVRHGESEANIDQNVYIYIPDNKIKLTQKGVQQAQSIGKKLQKIIQNQKIIFYVSPFHRTIQTYKEIQKNFEKNQYIFHEDPRIREQEWGNFEKFKLDPKKEKEIEEDRKRVGSFYYRFESGESGADVNDRISQFLDSFYRKIYSHTDEWRYQKKNVILVTHGMTIRCFIKRFFNMTVEQFEQLKNPKNCQAIILQKDQNQNYFILDNIYPDDD